MNLLARNVYALTQNQSLLETETLTVLERSSLEQLVEFRQTMPADTTRLWGTMAQGWYPVIDQLESPSPKSE